MFLGVSENGSLFWNVTLGYEAITRKATTENHQTSNCGSKSFKVDVMSEDTSITACTAESVKTEGQRIVNLQDESERITKEVLEREFLDWYKLQDLRTWEILKKYEAIDWNWNWKTFGLLDLWYNQYWNMSAPSLPPFIFPTSPEYAKNLAVCRGNAAISLITGGTLVWRSARLCTF